MDNMPNLKKNIPPKIFFIPLSRIGFFNTNTNGQSWQLSETQPISSFYSLCNHHQLRWFKNEMFYIMFTYINRKWLLDVVGDKGDSFHSIQNLWHNLRFHVFYNSWIHSFLCSTESYSAPLLWYVLSTSDGAVSSVDTGPALMIVCYLKWSIDK